MPTGIVPIGSAVREQHRRSWTPEDGMAIATLLALVDSDARSVVDDRVPLDRIGVLRREPPPGGRARQPVVVRSSLAPGQPEQLSQHPSVPPLVAGSRLDHESHSSPTTTTARVVAVSIVQPSDLSFERTNRVRIKPSSEERSTVVNPRRTGSVRLGRHRAWSIRSENGWCQRHPECGTRSACSVTTSADASSSIPSLGHGSRVGPTRSTTSVIRRKHWGWDTQPFMYQSQQVSWVDVT